MIESGDEDSLRLFYLLFRRDSFAPQEGATTSFLEVALAEGRRYEERVARGPLEGGLRESLPAACGSSRERFGARPSRGA